MNEVKEIKEENSKILNENKKIELKGIKIGKYFIEKPIDSIESIANTN